MADPPTYIQGYTTTPSIKPKNKKYGIVAKNSFSIFGSYSPWKPNVTMYASPIQSTMLVTI